MTDPSSKRNTPECDFVVAGGGVIGLASAVALATDGARIVVVDAASGPAEEASGAAAGIVSLLHPWRAPGPLQRLAGIGRALYPQWCAAVESATGLAVGWSEPGAVSFDTDGAPAGVPRLDAAALAARVPAVVPPRVPAVLLDAGAVEPRRLVTALAAYARTLGVDVRWRDPVARIIVESGRAAGVVLDDGSIIRAGGVVVAAGAWSGRLLATAGIAVPVKPIRGEVIELGGPPGLLAHIVLHQGKYLLPRPDGRLVVGSTADDAGFDRATTAAAAASLRAWAAALVPVTAGFPLLAHWAGLRPGSPAGVPTIGAVPDIAGLWLNSGHFRYGITLAPAAAALLAALTAGRPPPVPAAPFAL